MTVDPTLAPPRPVRRPARPRPTLVDRFLRRLESFKGQPYLWGGGHTGSTFRRPGPVDCSGLVSQAAKMAGIENLAGVTTQLEDQCREIPKSALRPGDLLFKGRPSTHVGIYMGGGKVLHAPYTGARVSYTDVGSFHWAARPDAFAGIRAQEAPAVARPGAPERNRPEKARPDRSALGPAGPQSELALPPAAAGGPKAYRRLFGDQGYVQDGSDAALLDLGRRVLARAPELARTALGRGLEGGSLDEGDIKQLQRFLERRGFDVGSTGVDGLYGPRTHRALTRFLASAPRPGRATQGSSPASPPAPEAPTSPAAPAAPSPLPAVSAPAPESLGRGPTKAGHRIPHGGVGRATVFANGHLPYKGWSDAGNRQNNGIGAWGDRNAPTEYFCALPVGFSGGGTWWHNQKILVTNPANGRQVVVRVQDKGPHPSTGNAIDLSPVAMEALGGRFNGALERVRFEFAQDDAPVGPVPRRR